MKARRIAVVAVALLGSTMLAQTPASASATLLIAAWQMNEPVGSRVLVDSSGNGVIGVIGTEVVPNGATHFFPYLKPNTAPAHPEHIDQSADWRLNPGTRDYAVTLRMKWTANFGNIIQKGQSGTWGGYFKLQAPSGLVQCLFRGSTGSGGVGSGRPLNDGLWHVIRCERTAAAVTMTVDGVVTGRHVGPTGSISNSKPLTIAGKASCDQITVTCDYWTGEMDWVTVEAGP